MPGLAGRPAREQAFQHARRHSLRVRFLRAGIVVAAISCVLGLALWSWLDPFRVLPPGVSVKSVGLNGTRVTMEQPKLAGFRKDGRAYSVSAESSVQDIRNPGTINLSGVTAKVAMADKSSAQVTAPSGVYDTKKEQMDFLGDVRVRSDSGYDLAMKSAEMDFKGSVLSTREPIVLSMKTGTINADSMTILNNGQQITFEGNVVTVMKAAAETAAGVAKGADQ